MKDSDLVITNRGNSYRVKVSGRANFEYAVPLRELAKTISDFDGFIIDLGECTAMDSTFMGVLSMLALSAKRRKTDVEIFNAAPALHKLLRDLGVAKLFVFKTGGNEEEKPASPAPDAVAPDMLALAETVAEAHTTLAEADSANADRFDSVIKYARADVERLKKTTRDEK